MTMDWIKQTEEAVELRLSGKLDTISSPAVLLELQKAAEEFKALTLNFEQVSYISSAGLRTLFTVQKQVSRSGGSMTLTAVAPKVMEVLELTGFSGILNIK